MSYLGKGIVIGLIIFLTSSCCYRIPRPNHTFNVSVKEDKVTMPRKDFDYLFEAYVLYYDIKVTD